MIGWVWVVGFVLLYPMLISIYVFLPLLIGAMGYLFIEGMEKQKNSAIIIAIFYFVNLELNLSLPFFLTLLSVMLFYLFFYHTLTYFHQCLICKPILSVLFIDTIYLGNLLAYDFIFGTTTVVLDNILLYSLVVDLLLVVIL